MADASTIAAVATAAANGAIGIVRISGSNTRAVLNKLCGRVPTARVATLLTLRDATARAIDQGIVLFYPGPASYTGEDLAELQVHGGSALLARLLREVFTAGAVPAKPGEFTERAFLNGKLDLLQAEAVADTITATTERALRAANLALTGVFSQKVHEIVTAITDARAGLEGLIDFSDEPDVAVSLDAFYSAIMRTQIAVAELLHSAQQGARLNAGATVVLVGRPNAGKSTLLNALAKEDRAIVSPIPGTTRDVLTVDLEIAGVQVKLHDTAGIHLSDEQIEVEGIRRARALLANADIVLCVYDTREPKPTWDEITGSTVKFSGAPIFVRNKIDLIPPSHEPKLDHDEVAVSASLGHGMDALLELLERHLNVGDAADTPMLARDRHLVALRAARADLAFSSIEEFTQDMVVSAERLRAAQAALSSLTGEVTSEDILGQIFSRFCIGK